MLAVKMLESEKNLDGIESCSLEKTTFMSWVVKKGSLLVFCKYFTLLKKTKQFAPRAVLERKKQFSVVLESIRESYDKRMNNVHLRNENVP